MKLRHVAPLALVVWCVSIRDIGKTVPKDCPNCGWDLSVNAESECGFKTKAECEAARDKWIPNFYANATKNGRRVAVPPSTPVCVQEPGAPK
jgi:hypothetical protein